MDAIRENVIAPLVRRLGTAAAVWLLAKGFDSATVEPLINWVSAGVLLVVDLLLARFYRRAVIQKAVASKVSAIVNDVRGFR